MERVLQNTPRRQGFRCWRRDQFPFLWVTGILQRSIALGTDGLSPAFGCNVFASLYFTFKQGRAIRFE